MRTRYKDKVVLVTGGSSGLGLATATLFAGEGATVYVTGRRPDAVARAVAEIGGAAVGVPGDVSRPDDLDRLYDRIGREAGRLDAVVANAGVGELVPLGSYTEEHLDRTFGVNVQGTAFTVQKALPLMPDGSAVVLLGSIAGATGTPAFGAYAASKAAIRSFARTWAEDLKARRIRVNVVSPGFVPTPAYDGLGLSPEALEGVVPRIPLGRVGRADEIARAVAFLASDESSYVNGAEPVVDGGLTQV